MTKFSDLYPSLRLLLGDIRPTPTYSNSVLDSAIEWALTKDTEFSEGDEDEGERIITPDITDKPQKQRLILQSAISLLDPASGPFAYRTRTLSVSRNLSQYVGNLKAQLRALDGATLPIAESEWTRFLKGSASTIASFGSFPG